MTRIFNADEFFKSFPELDIEPYNNFPTVEGQNWRFYYDHGYADAKKKYERPTGKPVIVTCDDMSNYCICPCCRKPIDRWDRYCKHCGAEMENG